VAGMEGRAPRSVRQRGSSAMSHTTRAAGGTVFTHNGDYSGDVGIVVRLEPRMFATPEGPTAWDVRIPFADLRELVFAYLRDRKSEWLEQCSDGEFEAVLLGTSSKED
jgi:hypothetical protein